ncbi:MAG: hypothetical protein ACTSUV_04950 [Candidatus Ranarchaeia archaeon]
MSKEHLVKVYFKDPQLPPGQNQRERYVNGSATISEIIEDAKVAFSLPVSMKIAFLFKGRKLNPQKKLADYSISESSVLMIVPDRIIGGY